MLGHGYQRAPSINTNVRLDNYISDLNLEIKPDGYGCHPLHKDGFAYMWAGAKATYGIRRGKVCFEVKIVENLPVSTSEFTDAHIVRVGWSTDAASLQLGEDKNSFGYGGTAKKSVGRSFSDYGRRFDAGDVIGCYLSISGGWVEISFCVNGYQCGTAFKIRWDDEALFPHILTKNCRIEVNFGQAHNPYFSLLPGFKLIGNLPVSQRVPSVPSPSSKTDCEVIMMVGLPGVGKTTWANNYAKLHPNKKYNILGTDAMIDKMRVQGLPRKDNFGGRWDVLIKQATECFNVMLRKASTCNRNLILDQTNVYASARRRKVSQYKEVGYTVNAMVLVPTDGDMISRSKQRTLKEGKEVPEAAVNDMKANFSLPHANENLFSSITFLELQREDAENLVLQYNMDASLKGYRSNKQSGQGANENQREILERRQGGPVVPDVKRKSPYSGEDVPIKRERQEIDLYQDHKDSYRRPTGIQDQREGINERFRRDGDIDDYTTPDIIHENYSGREDQRYQRDNYGKPDDHREKYSYPEESYQIENSQRWNMQSEENYSYDNESYQSNYGDGRYENKQPDRKELMPHSEELRRLPQQGFEKSGQFHGSGYGATKDAQQTKLLSANPQQQRDDFRRDNEYTQGKIIQMDRYSCGQVDDRRYSSSRHEPSQGQINWLEKSSHRPQHIKTEVDNRYPDYDRNRMNDSANFSQGLQHNALLSGRQDSRPPAGQRPHGQFWDNDTQRYDDPDLHLNDDPDRFSKPSQNLFDVGDKFRSQDSQRNNPVVAGNTYQNSSRGIENQFGNPVSSRFSKNDDKPLRPDARSRNAAVKDEGQHFYQTENLHGLESLPPQLTNVDFEKLRATLANVQQAQREEVHSYAHDDVMKKMDRKFSSEEGQIHRPQIKETRTSRLSKEHADAYNMHRRQLNQSPLSGERRERKHERARGETVRSPRRSPDERKSKERRGEGESGHKEDRQRRHRSRESSDRKSRSDRKGSPQSSNKDTRRKRSPRRDEKRSSRSEADNARRSSPHSRRRRSDDRTPGDREPRHTKRDEFKSEQYDRPGRNDRQRQHHEMELDQITHNREREILTQLQTEWNQLDAVESLLRDSMESNNATHRHKGSTNIKKGLLGTHPGSNEEGILASVVQESSGMRQRNIKNSPPRRDLLPSSKPALLDTPTRALLDERIQEDWVEREYSRQKMDALVPEEPPGEPFLGAPMPRQQPLFDDGVRMSGVNERPRFMGSRPNHRPAEPGFGDGPNMNDIPNAGGTGMKPLPLMRDIPDINDIPPAMMQQRPPNMSEMNRLPHPRPMQRFPRIRPDQSDFDESPRPLLPLMMRPPRMRHFNPDIGEMGPDDMQMRMRGPNPMMNPRIRSQMRMPRMAPRHMPPHDQGERPMRPRVRGPWPGPRGMRPPRGNRPPPFRM